jgi:hypothetical protein
MQDLDNRAGSIRGQLLGDEEPSALASQERSTHRAPHISEGHRIPPSLSSSLRSALRLTEEEPFMLIRPAINPRLELVKTSVNSAWPLSPDQGVPPRLPTWKMPSSSARRPGRLLGPSRDVHDDVTLSRDEAPLGVPARGVPAVDIA